MIDSIAQLLLERKGPNPPVEWLQMLPLTARRLEESLFRSAASFEEYRDTSTVSLIRRLQALATAKLEAKRLREQQQKRNADEEIAT